MNSSTAARLLQINRDFYDQFGASFSATRHRIQPGVRQVLETLKGDESILDLGCGNGELARTLAKRGHRGSYLGVDFSLPLLHDAEVQPVSFSAKFLQADLTSDWDYVIARRITSPTQQSPLHEDSASPPPVAPKDSFDLVFMFAVLHHIPGYELRLNMLKKVRALLGPDGRFIHSNWQFLNSEKLKIKIQPWEAVSISESEVDAGDSLLDWRSAGKGLRYVHQFSEDELSGLAMAAGFEIVKMFHSDGESGDLDLYHVWK
jgi:tRNA (uracil-5-)-methyltransferase TRM9